MKRKLLLVFLFSLVYNNFFGQQFPVNIIPVVNAPAPVNFYNYADETSLNSPITVQIFLNDLTVNSRQIRLKTYFEGGNIAFSSKDFVIGAQDLFIEGGVPLRLGINELAPYYKFENIQGINVGVYGKPIPEGSYNFCFEVYDYASGSKLSTKKCFPVFIFKNEPPILNLPFNGINIPPKDFENISFQWTPRHINVSNVEYEFSIVEIWDDAVNPQTAFLSQTPIYETTTRTTTLFYGPDKPLLLPNKRYAWRVKAKALQGVEEIGLFKNQGYSEVFWFSRTSPCKVPEEISAEAKGISKINVYWNEDPTTYSDYIIAYREADKPDAHWFTKKTNSGWATIWNLKPGTGYEYKVKGKCTYQYSEYSKVQYITTEIVKNEDADYQCGIVPDEIAISNREPHPGLTVGSQIKAGDFNVVITDITNQSPGSLSGKGYVSIPYLKFAKFAVEFSGILVNTDNQLAQGEIVTVYDSKFGEGASMTVDVNVNISEGIKGDAGDTTVKEVDFVVDNVTINADGTIVATGLNADGEPDSAIIPGDKDVKIKSSNGDIWTVGEDGKITKEDGAQGGAVVAENTNGVDSDGQVTQVTAEGVLVTFEDSGYYSYDALPKNTSSELEAEYKVIETKNGNKYEIPYKAISDNNLDNNGEDFIYADVKITDNTIVKDSIIFKTKEGAKVDVLSWNGNKAKLKLVRKLDYAHEEIYATIKNKEGKYDVAGTLITTHLASQELEAINVVLVPVGVDINSDLITKTKEIYAKAGVRLNIKVKPKVDKDEVYDLENLPRIDVGDSNLLSHYTADEKLFNKYIKNQTYYNKKTYYVSVTNIPTSDGNDLNGFMPLKRQFGFVFIHDKNNTVETQAKTLAHELGHGIFGLKHTWDEYKFTAGATDFLMDGKPEGTVLNHLDWKKLHAPGIQLYWFQGDEDGQHSTQRYLVGNNVIPGKFSNYVKANSFSFVSPVNKIFSIPNTAFDVTFEKQGGLLAFSLPENGKNERYVATVKGDKFVGYTKDFDSKTDWKERVYQDKISISSSGKQVVVYTGKLNKINENDCGVDLYKGEFKNTSSGKWNSGGNGKIFIKTFSAFNTITNRSIFVGKIPSPNACDLCPKGETYYKKYSYLAKNEASKESLLETAKLLCKDPAFYEVFLAQMDKDFSKKLDGIFWLSDKANYQKARDKFWEREDAFTLYYDALKNVKTKIDNYSKNLNLEVSEEKLNSALYYLNDEFIKTLSLAKKKVILKAIFKNNYFINDDFFQKGNSDISFIKKIVRTINISDLNDILISVAKLEGENEFTGSKKEVILEICNAIKPEDLKELSLDVKLVAIQRMLKWTMTSVAGSNYHDIIVKVIKSVKDEEANTFLNKLETVKGEYGFQKVLVYSLKEKLSNLSSNGDAYTEFFKELIRLTEARSKTSPNEYKIVAGLPYNVIQKDYILVSYVRDKNSYEYKYNNATNKINILTCKNDEESIVSCTEKIKIVEEVSPFDTVMLYFIEGNSPFNPIPNVKFHSDREKISAKGYLVPALFLEYLKKEQDNQRVKNFAMNTFNVVLTTATLGEGVAAITAVRVATGSGIKIVGRTIVKNGFSLLDFTYTVGKAGYEFGVGKLPAKFAWVDTFLMAKGTYDLVNGGLKGLASLHKASPSMRKTIISELEIKKDGYIISDSEFDDLIAKSVRKLESSTTDQRLRIAWEDAVKFDPRYAFGNLLKKIDGFDVKNMDFKTWVLSLKKESDLIHNLDELKKLDLKNFAKELDFTNTAIANRFTSNPILVKSWNVLRESPQIRLKEGNLEILADINKRFQYNNEQSFKGLNKLFNEGSQVASKQKLLDGLKEANKLFDDTKLPIEFSAIKKGEVTVNITSPNDAVKVVDKYGRGEEVGRYVDGILQKKKFLDDGDGVKLVKEGNTSGDDILQKGEDVGFRNLANAGSDWLVILKSNTSFKSYLDGLVANPSTRKFTNTLLVEEEAVLKFYTTNSGYKDFNKALRGEIPMTDFYIAQKNLMDQALKKLPNSSYNQANDLLYRIENLTNDKINTLYKEGTIITNKGFTSSTYSRSAIKEAMEERVHTVLIRIKGKNAKAIEDLSTLKSEKELIFQSNTRFKVDKVHSGEHLLLEMEKYKTADDIINFDGINKLYDQIRIIELIEL